MDNELRDAMRQASEVADRGPHQVYGQRVTLFDLVFDSGIPIGKASQTLSALYGLDVHYDETMPRGTVDFRHRDGRTLSRLIQSPDGTAWFRVDAEALRRLAWPHETTPSEDPA
jgi:hypothetical protein